MSEFKVSGLKKIRDGVYESEDSEGYEKYVSQRKIRQDIGMLKNQINTINSELSDIKQLLKQLVKVS